MRNSQIAIAWASSCWSWSLNIKLFIKLLDAVQKLCMLRISQGIVCATPLPAINRPHLELADMDTTIVSVAADYQVALRRINVSLPIELIEELLDLMGQLKDAGKVRQSDNKQHSVLDFIGNVVEKTGPRVVWKRLLEAHPDTVTFCNSVKLPRIDGKKGNLDSPVTNELGLMTIAYLLPGKLGDRIRKASAQLVVEALAGYRNNLLTTN